MADLEDEPLVSDTETSPLQHAKDQRAVENDVIPETATVGRNIGWGSAYILVISRVIGSGIFAMPGNIVQNVGSPGLALCLWVAGAVVAWAGLAIDLEYGCMLPRSGGIKVYLEYTFRRPRFLATTMVTVQVVLLGFSATNCIVFAKYTIFATGQDPTDWTTKLLAIGLLTFVITVHSCFYKTGIWLQNVLGWIKVALITFMIFTGLFVMIFRPSTTETDISRKGLWDDTDWSWNNSATALFKIAYSYAGLNNLNNVMNEVKNPVRTLKTIAPLALLTACIMYVLINLAYLAVVPLDEIKQSRELIAALFFERVFGAGFGNVFLPLAIALSAAGNVMVVTFSLARLNQEVARQGFLPWGTILASSKPFNAPMGGFLIQYVTSTVVIMVPPSGTVYAFIADVEGYSSQFFLLALAIGLLLLRYKRPELHRPYRSWLSAVGLRMALCICLIAAPLFPPKKGTGDVDFFYATYALVGISVFVKLLSSYVSNVCSFAFGFSYWAVWTRLLPRYRGYRLEEEADVLDDGTTVTRLVRKEL